MGKETRGGFHVRDGWFFVREVDGAVTLERRDSIREPNQEPDNFRLTFDASTWASIVASVTAKGDNAETFALANSLHDGRLAKQLKTIDD